MSWIKTPLGMFTLGGLVVTVGYILNPFGVREKLGFNADALTYSDLEQIQIERSGVTADVIPESLTEAFMGYKFLDLQSTRMTVNTDPFGPGVSDVQPRYINPYDVGYTISNEVMADFQAEETNRVFNALAPGQETSYLGGGTANTEMTGIMQRKEEQVRSYDNATTQTTGIDYSGRTPCCRVPPEVNHDFPYLVSMIPPAAVPFKEAPSAFIGSNRFGDNAIMSESENLNGREGMPALNPNVNAGFTSPDGHTKTLSNWRTSHILMRVSDNEVRALPMSGGTEMMLRRA